MGSRIEHRATYPQDVPAVLAAAAGEEALRARLKELGGKGAALVERTETANGVSVKLRHGIAAELLPQAVRTLHKGDVIVEREETFTKVGDGYTGTVKAGVSGVPGEITARTELKSVGGETLLRTTGEIRIRIPLFGAKLESGIAEQLNKLLKREAEFTAKWLAEHA